MNDFDAILQNYNLFYPEDMYKVVCPFHGDLNPSLQINRVKGYFYCYGCGVHGEGIDLVKLYNPKLNPLQVMKLYKDITKGCKDEPIPVSEKGKAKKRLSQSEALKLSRQFYETLPDPNWFKPSLNQAIYEETMQAKRYMLGRGFNSNILNEMGAKPSLNTFYPIVFPILENDKFKGYVMRTFNPEVEAKRKYLYNPGFRRQLTLPGRYTKEQPLLVVEGYLDCLKAIQLGIPNVVSFLGWKPSAKQINKIKRNRVPLIISGLDNDEAGDKGHSNLLDIFHNTDTQVIRLIYPKGVKDFGDLKKGTPELREVKKFLYKLF